MNNTLQRSDHIREHKAHTEIKKEISIDTVRTVVNYTYQGKGTPVLLIHGLAASLHDWDFLAPELADSGYTAYALDLLGHGGSAKPASRAYEADWVFNHLVGWIDSLSLTQAPVLIGHSLGGYLTLDYARKHPQRVRAIVLVDPFYKIQQLPAILRLSYNNPALNTTIMERIPQWAFRLIIDVTSVSLGHTGGALHTLPDQIREQTALDYKRTAPGIYNVPHTLQDLTDSLPSLNIPSLIIWGNHDNTLAPASFQSLSEKLPQATSTALPAGHVPHQSNADEFNKLVLDFLSGL